MSDIRKAIMARLGEFARPGAKAEMGTVSVNTSASTADLLTEVQRLRDKIKTSGSDFDKSLLEMVKKELERRGVAMMSRFGAKAAFDRRIEVDHWTSPKGTKYVAGVHERGGGTSFQPFISATYSDGGEQLMTGNAPTFKTEKGARKWLDTEIGRRKSVSSRPGAKAAMAKWTVVMPSIPDAGTRHFDSWEQAKNYVDTKMGGFTALVSVDGKRYALKHALGQWEKFSRPGAKARFEENCGTGAGGFKPGNKCGADDGKGGGGGPEDKKHKPKRTPLAGPKVAKPAKIPSRTALNYLAQNAPEYREDWQDAKDALSGRTDPQSTKLLKEMVQVSDRWSELQDAIDNLYAVPIKKNREAALKKRKDIADELNLLQQRAKRIIRDVGKTEPTAKRSPIEQARNLVYRTLKAQEALGGWNKGLLSDVGDALSDLRARGGEGSGKMWKALKAMEEEWRGLQRDTDAISTNYIDMKEKQPDNEQEARALKQRAGQLLQKTGDWRKRAQELVKQVKAQASRTGDRRLFALAVRAQKILAHRPGVKAQMGLLDRLGTVATAAVSAATAKPFDPTNPQVAKDLEAAKRAAITEVNNYKFFKEFNDAQFKALDDYVKATAKSIAGLRSSQDVARLTNGIKQAVAARNLIRKTLKTPFSRPGAKAKFGITNAASAFLKKMLREYASMKGTRWYDEAKYISDNPTEHTDADVIAAVGNLKLAKSVSSRPGAKSTNALSDACWQGYEAVGTKKQDGKTVPNCVPKATAAKPEHKAKNCTVDAKPLAYGKGDGALEREDVKAGLKLMEKADPKVSEKIRTLIKEGKPQDQAVAIALDMKRRGEL